ncbi:MAG TPA: hypothetical protein VFM53_12855 [Anaeromyxobacteraceae bacterium]|nr:hypothetical protein [Anaeromyxobacteraceae bacterium]
MLTLRAAAAVLAAALASTGPALAQVPGAAQPPASQVTPDPWPKTATRDGTTFELYQPQVDSWDDYTWKARAAVRILPAGSQQPVFGTVGITAYTIVDRPNRVVYVEGITITRATFPSAPASAPGWQAQIQAIASEGPATISLARMEQALAIEGAERKARRVPVQNPPPRIVFTERDAALVLIHGDPVWTQVPGTSLQRVMNTRALLLRDGAGRLYLHLLDGFVTATGLAGPWSVARDVPSGAADAARSLSAKGLVDLLEGSPDEKTHAKPRLAAGVPEVVVSTTPTEVITSNGPMDWQPLEGTQLLYVGNTTGNVFLDLADQRYYVLVTGRWFRAAALTGPWTFVAGKDLPGDFFLIPDTSPKENVKASIPGTPQAEEAAIAAEIPHMATVHVDKVSFVPVVNGAPDLRPVDGTTLLYVFNSPQAILMVAPGKWYAVQAGVWFTAPSIDGPWTVATAVPAVVYSIPPSSPLYYVTFVRVYAASPGVVVVGYTPGYTGVVVTPDGTIVYGTGYVYPAYVTATVWYPPPVTYGYAANPTYTPWTGFAMGFAIGWSAAHWCYAPTPYWGAMPYYYHPPVPYGGAYYGTAYHGTAYGAYGGAATWGPGGWAATSGNMYGHYGSTSTVSRDSAGYNAYTGTAWSSKVGTSYNSTTGRMSAGQSAAASNAYTGGYAYGNRGATYNPTTGASASGGRATVGNAYTGQQATVGRAEVTGPGGQTTHVAQVNDQYYASHDGNTYSYNSATGQTQKYDGSTGTWQSTQKPAGASASASSAASSYDRSSGTYSYQKPSGSSGESVSQSRSAGDSRSASSAWGGSWGGSSSHSGGWGGGGGGWGGGGGGGGGWGGGGGGGWGGGGGGDRGGGGGGWGGSDRSWGGGGWGGGGGGGFGGFHGGGRR